MRLRLCFVPLFVVLLVVSIAVRAQSECPVIIETGLSEIDAACADIGRNQACYGHVAIETELNPNTTAIEFSDVGDVIDVANIRSMHLSPLDQINGQWGVAVMRLQANIPNTLPGQNVTMLLFGDVELTTAESEFADANPAPMQAFYLTTGVGDAGCVEAPESGVLIQTPEGISEVSFNINGVDVAMGSTVLFQAQPDVAMSISVLEGSALVNLDGEIATILDGTQLQLELNADSLVSNFIAIEAYTNELVANLPIDQLQREIKIAIPRIEEEIDELQHILDQGLPFCDGESLPDCDDLPWNGIINGLSCFDDAGDCNQIIALLDELDIDIPDVDIPNIDIPDVNMPDINIPDVDIPDIDVPGVDINIPDFGSSDEDD